MRVFGLCAGVAEAVVLELLAEAASFDDSKG